MKNRVRLLSINSLSQAFSLEKHSTLAYEKAKCAAHVEDFVLQHAPQTGKMCTW